MTHLPQAVAILFALSTMCIGVRGAEPLVNLSANQMEFSPQPQGMASTPKVVVLTNNGAADLLITSFTLAGENKIDFVQTNNCPTSPSVLAALAHCEIRVTFNPTITGTLTGTLNIADNASGSPQTVNLKGVSTAPGPSAVFGPASLAFPNQAVGTASAERVISLTNTGSATMNINSELSINGPNSTEFRLVPVKNSCPSGTWQLAPKTGCDIGVMFAPTSLGVKNAQISIQDDAPGSPHSVELSGTGAAPTSPKN